MRADGKVIVVTGGGSGIGRALVLELLKRGAKVAALDVSEAGLKETAQLAGAHSDRISTHVADVTDRDAVAALPEAIIGRMGQFDGLINCAGIIQPFVRFKDLTYDDIDRVMRVNLYGQIHMLKEFLPYLLERPEAHIVNVSSMGAYVPVPGQTMYGASKAAVMLMTEGLYSELIDTPVRVTIAFPGATKTNISVNSGVQTAADAASKGQASKIKMMSAEDTAVRIVDGMERNAYRVMAGPDAAIMDRLSRISPKRAAKIIYQQMRELLPE